MLEFLIHGRVSAVERFEKQKKKYRTQKEQSRRRSGKHSSHREVCQQVQRHLDMGLPGMLEAQRGQIRMNHQQSVVGHRSMK